MARFSERPRRYVKSRLTGNAAAAGHRRWDSRCRGCSTESQSANHRRPSSPQRGDWPNMMPVIRVRTLGFGGSSKLIITSSGQSKMILTQSRPRRLARWPASEYVVRHNAGAQRQRRITRQDFTYILDYRLTQLPVHRRTRAPLHDLLVRRILNWAEREERSKAWFGVEIMRWLPC